MLTRHVSRLSREVEQWQAQAGLAQREDAIRLATVCVLWRAMVSHIRQLEEQLNQCRAELRTAEHDRKTMQSVRHHGAARERDLLVQLDDVSTRAVQLERTIDSQTQR